MTDISLPLPSSSIAIISIATVFFGPVLGEWITVLSLGLLGTLIALSEEVKPTLGASFWFVFRGMVFSIVFSNILTSIAQATLPTSNINYYVLIGVISFVLGWMSNKMTLIKAKLLSMISGFKGGSK